MSKFVKVSCFSRVPLMFHRTNRLCSSCLCHAAVDSREFVFPPSLYISLRASNVDFFRFGGR